MLVPIADLRNLPCYRRRQPRETEPRLADGAASGRLRHNQITQVKVSERRGEVGRDKENGVEANISSLHAWPRLNIFEKKSSSRALVHPH